MKIKADGRGRISLRQLNMPGLLENIGATPHAEYEVEPHPEGGVTINPTGQHNPEPEPEWQEHFETYLKPELIGTVIGVKTKKIDQLPRIQDYGQMEGVFGVLESYSVYGSITTVTLKGGTTFSSSPEADNERLQSIWVKH